MAFRHKDIGPELTKTEWEATDAHEGVLPLENVAPLNPSPAIDNTGNGLITVDTVGDDVEPGDVLCMKTTGKYYGADADMGVNMPAKVMAMETKNADELCKLLHIGYFRHDAWNWVLGNGEANLLYVSTTMDEMVQFANKPSGIDDRLQVVGYVVTADIVFFNPSYTMETIV